MTKREQIQLFENRKVRTAWDDVQEKWYFSIVDVVEVLTDSAAPTDYLKKMRKRDPELGTYIGTNCPQVVMTTFTGKKRKTIAADVEQLFRIIQSIPSPKAEPFKQWLARVGYERIQEIENPELAQERMKAIYEAKGYPKDWIDKRLRGIAIRQNRRQTESNEACFDCRGAKEEKPEGVNLTDEWKERGITEQKDFAILTAEIAKATFGVTPSEHKEIKGLTKKSQNLRDHMTDLELIFTMLGERVTTEVSQKEKPEGMRENVKVAKRGGSVAGVARKAAEKEIGHSVVSDSNFLDKNPDSLLIGGLDEE